ncbi:DUF6397 family protein [Streptomyces sp. NPDC093225]|uniref:DUF6397 family protein n=1 Tax=Streptomyces sp. NPDC093225 TaxID=3366034 RepID=UPI00380E2AC2
MNALRAADGMRTAKVRGAVTVRRTAVPLGAGRAAEELGLRRAEFELAAELGLVRADAGPRRWSREEIERVRGGTGFPEALYERVRTVNTGAGAGLLGIGTERLRALTKCGYLTPVGYRVNRYRMVVWLYLAQELREFRVRERGLAVGPLPARDRRRLAAGADVRARNWRGRRTGLLLARTTDPWERAAVVAALLEPPDLALVVPEEAERALLTVLAPPRPYGHPHAPAAAEVADRLLRAREPDEIIWYSASLGMALAEARSAASGSRPGGASVEGDRREGADIDPRAAFAGEAAVLVQ